MADDYGYDDGGYGNGGYVAAPAQGGYAGYGGGDMGHGVAPTAPSPGMYQGGGAGNDTSPGDGGRGGKKRGDAPRQNRTVIPITIGTINLLAPDAANDYLTLPDPMADGTRYQVNMVRMVGRIVQINDEPTCCTILLTDGTGSVTVQHFMADDDIHWANLRPKLQPHTFIEVLATAKLVAGNNGGSAAGLDGSGGGFETDTRPFCVSLSLLSLKHVSDGNLVTMHLLESLYTQSLLNKGPLPPPAARSEQTGQQGFGTGAFGGAAAGGYGAARGSSGMGGGGGWGAAPVGGGFGGAATRVAASAGPGFGAPRTDDERICEAIVQHCRETKAQADEAGVEHSVTLDELVAKLQRYGFGGVDRLKVKELAGILSINGTIYEQDGEHWALADG